VARTGTAVCGVVERFGTPSVSGTNFSTVRCETFGDVYFVCGRSNMQRSVAFKDVVVNCAQEVRIWILPGRSGLDCTSSKVWLSVKAPNHLVMILSRDHDEEPEKCTVFRSIELPTSFGHPHSLPSVLG